MERNSLQQIQCLKQMISEETPGISTDRRTRRALLANLRHEIRTPINAIIGYSDMLLEEMEGEEESNPFFPDLQKIQACGTQLLALVNTILDPDKPESSQLDTDIAAFGERIRVELRTPLTAAIGYCELLLEEAPQDLVPDLNRIRTAAERLLNTIGDIVSLSQRQLQENDPQDTEGLDLAVEDKTASALMQQVVTTMRSLDEDQERDRGLCQGKILIVDDNETNRDLLSRQLERQGYTVTTAANGQQALQKVESGNPDLLLLDIIMPGRNGYQVLEQLKGEEKWRDIPVIMISALDELDSVVHCIEIGAEDYLPKPFNPVLLRARIGACLEKKRLRDQEIEYLRQVAKVTDAASQVEVGEFNAESLSGVAAHSDALGQLARVFQNMAKEVFAREQRLKKQVEELRIEIDQSKRTRQVTEITGTNYFQELKQKAKGLRSQFGQKD